jgi:hypothetical protein
VKSIEILRETLFLKLFPTGLIAFFKTGGKCEYILGMAGSRMRPTCRELVNPSLQAQAINSVVLSPLANYTDRAIAAGQRS